MTPLRSLLIAFCIFLPWNTAFAGEYLRIATEGAYPPFNEIDKNGKIIGFDVDIAMALCEAMERECTIEAMPWDELLPALADDQIDMIVASMARTPEREKLAAFTDYYYRSRTAFVGDPAKPFVQTREGVSGMVIATQAKTVQERYLRDNFEGSATILTTQTIGEALDALAIGKADAVLSDSLTIFDFLQTHAGTRFDFIGKPLPAEDPSSEASIAVNKDAHLLLQDINKALKKIRLSGVYEKINRKYFPFSIY